MKIRIYIFLLPFYLFSSSVGNPSNPFIIQEGFLLSDTLPVSLRAGNENMVFFNEKNKFVQNARQLSFHQMRLNGFASSGYAVFTVKEWGEIYAFLGAMSLNPSFKIGEVTYQAKTENRLIWKTGAKLIVLQWDKVILGVDVNLNGYDSPSIYVDRNKTPLVGGFFKFHMKQWQIAAGLSTKIGVLYPYAGAVFLDNDMKMKEISFSERRRIFIKQPHRLGAFLGTTLSPTSNILLAFELRLINEYLMTCSGEIRF